ncbi:hypothetical protein VTK26DRAFT_2831 [Humicola hyalothermophila]
MQRPLQAQRISQQDTVIHNPNSVRKSSPGDPRPSRPAQIGCPTLAELSFRHSPEHNQATQQITMDQQPTFSSNNPFRRKLAAASVPSSGPPSAVPAVDGAEGPTPTSLDTAPPLRSGDQFLSHLQALSRPSQPPPATSFQKPKVVKKVRVQSPPPSPSPTESAGAPDRFSPAFPKNSDEVHDDDESSSSIDTDDQLDPFSHATAIRTADAIPSTTIVLRGPPPNPFQKTLRDIEAGWAEPSQTLSWAAGTENTVDVDRPPRLPLAEQVGNPGSPQETPLQPARHAVDRPSLTGDGGSITDASSIPLRSISDTMYMAQETLQTSHETSEREGEDDRRGLISSNAQSNVQPAPGIIRKKPPPPSSRHGKLINPGAGGDAKTASSKSGLSRIASAPVTAPSRQRPPTPSDVNKPLPPAPLRSPAEEAAESVFDREAAGKVPEAVIQPGLNIVIPPRPPTPPNAPHAPQPTSSAARKPAPPPRRQPHGRSESRTGTGGAGPLHQQEDADSSLRRSSIDSVRSRSSSLRASVHAPAPPPPRRPSHAPRASSSFSSPPPVTSPGREESPSEFASATAATQASLPAPIVASPPPMSGTPTPTSSSRASPTVKPVNPPATAALNQPFHLQSHSPLPPQTQQQQQQQQQQHVHTKISPPPPPPARNASVRARKRPVSSGTTLPSSSLSDSTTTTAATTAAVGVSPSLRGGNTSAHPHPQPPPPPRRRGDSGRGGTGSGRGSLDGVPHPHPHPAVLSAAAGHGAGNGAGNSSASDNVGGEPNAAAGTRTGAGVGIGTRGVQDSGGRGAAEEMGDGVLEGEGGGGAGKEGDILADLDLLRKEVDALRGKRDKTRRGRVGFDGVGASWKAVMAAAAGYDGGDYVCYDMMCMSECPLASRRVYEGNELVCASRFGNCGIGNAGPSQTPIRW